MESAAGRGSADRGTSLVERRRAVTYRDIADAALGLFERQGYDETTVAQIAAAAGVSMRTFYRYCASKDETLTWELANGPGQLVSNIRKRSELSLHDAVVAGFVESAGIDEHRRLLRVILDAPALRSAWLAAGREAQDDLVTLVAERMPHSTPLRAHALAAAITAILTSVIERWAESDEDLGALTNDALGVLAV